MTFSTEKEWQKAIDIFEDRIRGRFLKIIDLIDAYEYSGFAVLALGCLLIETLQQFREGVPETPPRRSRDYFVRFLTETSFGKFFDRPKAEIFYEQIRCGILHQAEIKGSSKVLIRRKEPLLRFADDKKGLIVNRRLFHSQLLKEFENYVSRLRKADSPNEKLRNNFRKKMDYICHMFLDNMNEGDVMEAKVSYFAYGSNMKTDRFCKRVPSAKPLGRGKILNKKLVCNKKSKDTSGKANLEDSEGEVVWGVLYEIDSSDLEKLDKAEEGYQRSKMYVQKDNGKQVEAEVYISTELNPEAIPFDWYKELLVSGAQEHLLPEKYVEFLKKIPSKQSKQ